MNSLPMQRLVDGSVINIFDLKPAEVEVRTIAHSLSLLNRFNGHCLFPYSVAQHSVYVALRVYELTQDPDAARIALLHDASEAFIGDIIRPLKQLRQFEFYLGLEYTLQRTILESVGLLEKWDVEPNIRVLVNTADNEMLSQEMMHLFSPPFQANGYSVPRYETVEWSRRINSWHWLFARKLFLYCFDHPDATEAYLKAQDGHMNSLLHDNDKATTDPQPARFSTHS